MAQIVAPPTSTRTLLFGAMGGVMAALVALAALCGLAIVQGASVYRPLNAIGAWTVRWLQTADLAALDQFLSDATPAGIFFALVLGALVGAVFAALCRRVSDAPVGLGLGAGLVMWAMCQWQLAPALDPVIQRAFKLEVLLGAFLVYGLVLGGWVQAGSTMTDIG